MTRPTSCERRIADLRDGLREARSETDEMIREALDLCRRARLVLDTHAIEVSVREVQAELDRRRPRR